MPLRIMECDITTLNTDAIVNPADVSLPEGCRTGEEALLGRCYRNALTQAAAQGCERVAVPLLSAGACGCPPEQALHGAIQAIGSFLMDHEMEVTLVLHDRRGLGPSLFPDLQALLTAQAPMSSAAVELRNAAAPRRRRDPDRPGKPKRGFGLARLLPKRDHFETNLPLESAPAERDACDESACPAPDFAAGAVLSAPQGISPSLEALLRDADESFQQMLLRKIDQRGLTDAQCYKRANVDRKLFSKIRKDVLYRPKKTTAIAFAIALELDLEETEELLRKAGYALSPSTPFDIIIRYFIQHRNYDIFEINEALFLCDQTLLGA